MTLNDDALTIPDFLLRKPKKGRPRKVEQKEHSVESKYIMWDEIKQKRYGSRYDIQLGDEAPRIGSGLRIVYVKEGRKWAHMTSHSGDPADNAGRVRKRLSLKRWFDMKARHEKRQARHERAVKKIRKKANETNA